MPPIDDLPPPSRISDLPPPPGIRPEPEGTSDPEKAFLTRYKATKEQANSGDGLIDRTVAGFKAWQMENRMERSGPGGVPYADASKVPIASQEVSDGINPWAVAIPGAAAARFIPRWPSAAKPEILTGSAQFGHAPAAAASSSAPATGLASRAVKLLTNPKAVLLGGAGAYVGKDALRAAGDIGTDVLGDVISSMTRERVDRLLEENPDIAQAISDRGK